MLSSGHDYVTASDELPIFTIVVRIRSECRNRAAMGTMKVVVRIYEMNVASLYSLPSMSSPWERPGIKESGPVT